MIVVEIKLVSALGRERDRNLGQIQICNDGNGTAARGNYSVSFFGANGFAGKSGRVENYPRQAVSVFNLIRRACEAAGYTK